MDSIGLTQLGIEVLLLASIASVVVGGIKLLERGFKYAAERFGDAIADEIGYRFWRLRRRFQRTNPYCGVKGCKTCTESSERDFLEEIRPRQEVSGESLLANEAFDELDAKIFEADYEAARLKEAQQPETMKYLARVVQLYAEQERSFDVAVDALEKAWNNTYTEQEEFPLLVAVSRFLDDVRPINASPQ